MAQQPAKPQHKARHEEREDQREASRDAREDEREAQRKADRRAAVEAGLADPEIDQPETIADEQRERSAEIEDMGVEEWKAAHDERGPAEKQKVVPGVSTHGDAKTLEPGTSRR